MSFEQETLSPRRLEVLERLSDQAAPAPHHHRFWVLVVVGLVVVVLAVGSFVWTRKTGELPPAQALTALIPSKTDTDDIATDRSTDDVATVSKEADQDRDGLPDIFEYEHGLDPARPDSDLDGLFDREEVEVYKTNPLATDSDQDGIPDGQEVRTNQNPKGPGALRVLPSP